MDQYVKTPPHIITNNDNLRDITVQIARIVNLGKCIPRLCLPFCNYVFHSYYYVHFTLVFPTLHHHDLKIFINKGNINMQ